MTARRPSLGDSDMTYDMASELAYSAPSPTHSASSSDLHKHGLANGMAQALEYFDQESSLDEDDKTIDTAPLRRTR